MVVKQTTSTIEQCNVNLVNMYVLRITCIRKLYFTHNYNKVLFVDLYAIWLILWLPSLFITIFITIYYIFKTEHTTVYYK